jgi:hypothetical protein
MAYFFAEDACEIAAQEAGTGELEDPPRVDPEMITEGEHLVRIFWRLPNQNLRRLIISLIKSIAAREQNRG